MNESKLMIYGAYGYSGELMVREALKQGIKPIIAGRVAEKLAPIANELNLEYRVFNVKDASGYLQDVTVLLNCAGPFSATAEVLVKACLTQKAVSYTHLFFQTNLYTCKKARSRRLLPGTSK